MRTPLIFEIDATKIVILVMINNRKVFFKSKLILLTNMLKNETMSSEEIPGNFF